MTVGGIQLSVDAGGKAALVFEVDGDAELALQRDGDTEIRAVIEPLAMMRNVNSAGAVQALGSTQHTGREQQRAGRHAK